MEFNPNELELLFNEQRFWHKLRANLRRAGKEVIRHCLCLHYAAQKPETPLWAKTVVYGALAYCLIPLDAIPDAVFVIGYSDDLAVLSAVLVTISLYVDADVEQEADRKLRECFGN